MDEIDVDLVTMNIQQKVQSLFSDADVESIIVFQALNAAMSLNMVAQGADPIDGLTKAMTALETIVALCSDESQQKGVDMFGHLADYVVDVSKVYEK